ncbi:hyccin isoform X2 [Condylostylus longicornis]|uniref:hyccin isoform X2 n=1 Tax=Condylostylus longicornis TaxID=2530218 RepID=UPI00244DCEEA|nr:hyccin isoform X2 [Condylostylus longicornis]
MAEAIVQDWLSEYESIEDDEEMRVFANMHEMNPEVVDAIYTILNERIKYPDLVHSVCNQFHSFYRSSEEKLRRFALQFIPVLIYIYLNSVAMGDKKNCRSVETLLISIYNIEVSTDDGQPKIVSFRMPVLAQASIYHEEKSTLHATDLRRWEENINRDVKWGPLPQIELINAQNRMKIMTALLFCYNQQLSLIQKAALLHLCRVASQIVNQGFAKSGHVYRTSYGSDPSNVTSPSALSPKASPRIALSSPFLIELVHSIYFAMFNDFGTIAIQTLEDIHHRACYEMFADSILVTNAVRHSLHANPSGQPNDGPMGLSVALTPATTTVVVSKSMITNASFRTKKLPDDLDMEFLARLPPQLIERNENLTSTEILNNGSANSCIDDINNLNNNQSSSTQLPKDGKNILDAMKMNPRKWKNWGWKYSPGSKTSSIEEEPDSPKKSLSSSKNSSPNNSPKIKTKQLVSAPTNGVNQNQQQLNVNARDENGTLLPITSGNSTASSALMLLPAAIRRKKTPSPIKKSSEIRSSAGARLYQTLEDSQDDSADEHDSLLGNVRPASIHVLQTSAGYTILNK